MNVANAKDKNDVSRFGNSLMATQCSSGRKIAENT